MRRYNPARAAGLLFFGLLASAACSDGATPVETGGAWGGFHPPAGFASGGGGITSLAAGELTGDGSVDVLLVTRTPSPAVRILPGTGNGFGAPRVLQGLNDAIRATAADVTGDGRMDVLAVGHFDNGMRLWPGSAAGPGAAVPYALANHGRSVITGDWDGDGPQDAIAVHDGSGQPVTLTAFRGGAAQLQRGWEHRSATYNSSGSCTGDLDRDGRLDVAIVTGTEAAPVLVFAGRGDGTFGLPRGLPPVGVPAGSHDGAVDVACGDLDGDGRADLVTAHSAGFVNTGRDVVTVRLGGAGVARYEVALPEPRAVRLADLDRDGRLDAIIAHMEEARLSVLPGRGDGTFGAATTIALEAPAGVIAVADVDGDGWPDLLASRVDNGAVVLLRNRGRAPAS